MRHASVVAAAIALSLAACAREPVAPAKPRASRARRPGDGCTDAAKLALLARSHADHARALRALVLADRAVSQCPELGGPLASLRANAAATLGQCDRAEQLDGAAARAQIEACRKYFKDGDMIQSRAMARAGQRRLAAGDPGGALETGGRALEIGASDEAILLLGRAFARYGATGQSHFDVAYARLAKSAGPPRLELAPVAEETRRAPSGNVVAIAGGNLFVYRAEIPDLGLVLPWTDPSPPPKQPELTRIGASGIDRFALAGAHGIDWLDPIEGTVVHRLPLEGYALRALGRRRLLATKLAGGAPVGSTALLDTTHPERLVIVRELEGRPVGTSTSEGAFMLRSRSRIEVHDADDGDVSATLAEPSDDVALSSTGEKIAGCTRDDSGSRAWVWDVRNASFRFRTPAACGADASPIFSPNDRLVAFGGIVFDADTGDRVSGRLPKSKDGSAPEWLEVALSEEGSICPRTLSGDGSIVITGCDEESTVRAAATGEPLLSVRGSVITSPAGSRFIAGDRVCDALLHECTSLGERCDPGTARFSRDPDRVTCSHGGGIRSITLDADGGVAKDEVAASTEARRGALADPERPDALRRALIAAGAPSEISDPIASADGAFVGSRLGDRYFVLASATGEPVASMPILWPAPPRGILRSGWLFGGVSARAPIGKGSDEALWLAPLSSSPRLLVARWTRRGMTLFEAGRDGAITLHARVGDGGDALVCRFGARIVTPLHVCEEAFLADEGGLDAPFSPIAR